MMYILNSAEIHEANSKAMSLYAKALHIDHFEIMPIAFVKLIHFQGQSKKLHPAFDLPGMNSTEFVLYYLSSPTNLKINNSIFSSHPVFNYITRFIIYRSYVC